MKRVIAAAILFGTCACGNGGAPIEGGAGSAEPGPKVAVTEESKRSEPLTAATLSRQFCDFLADEVPRLQDSDSRIAAVAGFAVDYAGWVGENAERVFKAAEELDTMTRSGCPAVRRQVLTALGRDSLAEVLGR